MILAYSLTSFEIEGRSYEFAIMRTLGHQKRDLVLLATLEGLVVGLPGIFLGFLTSFLLYIPVAFAVEIYSFTPMKSLFDGVSIAVAFVIGISMPLIGAFSPLRKVMLQTIRESLDKFSRTADKLKVASKKLEKFSFKPTEFVNSLLLIFGGLVVFFVLPRAFIVNDLSTYLRVLTVSLLFMIFGLVVLSRYPLTLFLKFIPYIAIFGPDRKFIPLLATFLKTHRDRNSKLSIIICICFSFIFYSSMVPLDLLEDTSRWTLGSDIQVTGGTFTNSIPRSKVESFFAKTADKIENYSFKSLALNNYPFMKTISLSPKSPLNMPEVQLFCVDKNFTSTVDPTFIMFYESKVEKGAIFNSLSHSENVARKDFTSQNYNVTKPIIPGYSFDVIASSSLQDGSQIAVNRKAELSFNVKYNRTSSLTPVNLFSFPANVIASADKISGFQSISRSVTVNSAVVISEDAFQLLVNYFSNITNYKNETNTLYSELFVKLKPDIQEEDRLLVVSQLRSLLTDNFKVLDLKEETRTLTSFSAIARGFISAVAIICVFICSVILFLATKMNVRDYAHDYGILLAIGIKRNTVVRLSVYESILLTASCVILGIVCGFFASLLFSLQYAILSDMPLLMRYQSATLIISIVLALITSSAGTFLAINEPLKKAISSLLKDA